MLATLAGFELDEQGNLLQNDCGARGYARMRASAV